MCAEPASKASSGASTSRIECSLDNDARLLASLGVVMAHAARLAGLPEETQEGIASVAADASREMAASNGTGSGGAATKLVVDEFPDRVEVTIGSSAASKSEGILKRLEGKIGDRIRCESRDGHLRVTLRKS